MLKPKTRKYKKAMKGRNHGIATSGCNLIMGCYGIKAVTRGRISSNQLEAARRTLTHCMKRWGRVVIRVFPDKPITKKPAEVRMGNGKGNVDHYVFETKPGKMLYEMEGVDRQTAISAYQLASAKLPVQTVFVEDKHEVLNC